MFPISQYEKQRKEVYPKAAGYSSDDYDYEDDYNQDDDDDYEIPMDDEDEEYEEEYEEEEEVPTGSATEEAELAEEQPPVETAAPTAEEEEMPTGCPENFVLNFLWLDKYIAIAIDQVYSKEKRSPLTEYFVWPRTDAWEELQKRLGENPWIEQTDQILLLNRATEVINFWQDEEKSHSLEEARIQFPDCIFTGA